MEVANSQDDPCAICRARLYQDLTIEPEVADNLGSLCVICTARDSSTLPKPGSEMANSLGDLCAICMIRDSPNNSDPHYVYD